MVILFDIFRSAFLSIYRPGYGEPYAEWAFLRLDGWNCSGLRNLCEGYLIIETRGRCGRDMKMLPEYSVFRVQRDPVFGWYFKRVN